MFKFLKEKLKSAISKISEGVEREGKEEETTAEKLTEEPKAEQKGFFAKLKEKFSGKGEMSDGKKEAIEEKKIKSEEKQEIKEKPIIGEHKKIQHPKIKPEASRQIRKEEPSKKPEAIPPLEKIPKKAEAKEEPKATYKEPEKKGFFAAIAEKIITTKIDGKKFDELFWDLEMALMENNVAVEVIEKIKSDLKSQIAEKPIKRTKVEETILEALKASVEELFAISSIDLVQEIKNKKEKPYVMAFFGINGSGKTTSIAKIANMLKVNKLSCVLAASDTFRAASIEQLQQHADKLEIKMIKHGYGSDPAAVAFDAIKHAKAKNIDAVLIDTAGRMHSNANLIDELKKITRVTKPDIKIFVGESIAGNDCVEQAKTFNESVGIDGIILAKADIDEKGGAAISVSYVTGKPILYFGVGQGYNDIEKFDKEKVIRNIGLA